jgi:hypothetical protein
MGAFCHEVKCNGPSTLPGRGFELEAHTIAVLQKANNLDEINHRPGPS